MNGTLTPSERLTQLDREVEELKQAFVDAAQQLQQAPEVDASYDDRWQSIAQRLRDVRAELQAADYDKEQLAEMWASLFDIRDLMSEDQTLDTLDELVLASERVRHVIRDALDEQIAGTEGDTAGVIEELLGRLPHTNRDDVAQLVGVNRRTLNRWAQQPGPPKRRLRTVARLVAILRHNWTEDGTLAWFHRPRRELGERTPLAVLREENFDDEALIAAARAGRSMYAT